MNERIKELAEQAEKMVEHSWGDPNYRDDDYNRAFDEWQEKFAELIIRECLLVTKKQYNETLPWGGVEDTIYEHFGVEE